MGPTERPAPKHPWSSRWADPGTIFEGLATDYDRFRPRYCNKAIDWLAQRPRRIADIASGTGILTRQLRSRFPDSLIVGIEPARDMLRIARSADPDIHWLGGRAERLPLARGAFDLVTVGQAVHWFDRDLFHAECSRILGPGGILAILNNNRIRDSAVSEAYETALENISPGYRRTYRDHDRASELAALPYVRSVRARRFTWSWARTRDEWLGYVRSTSHFRAAEAHHDREVILSAIEGALAPFIDEAGQIAVPYETEVIAADFTAPT
ncbi:MAG: methyltransferase domain-containing protein [bacterium]|nr:methyltransferase domain-containing protein [bacterium]